MERESGWTRRQAKEVFGDTDKPLPGPLVHSISTSASDAQSSSRADPDKPPTEPMSPTPTPSPSQSSTLSASLSEQSTQSVKSAPEQAAPPADAELRDAVPAAAEEVAVEPAATDADGKTESTTWRRLLPVGVVALLLVAAVVGGVVAFVVGGSDEPAPRVCKQPCAGNPPTWSNCTCAVHIANPYFKKTGCAHKLTWTDACEGDCRPVTTNATQCKSGDQSYAGNYSGIDIPCGNTSYCYTFAMADPKIAETDWKIYFKCYEQANIKPLIAGTGCGKDIGDGQCKMTVANLSVGPASVEAIAGLLCCCANNLCNGEDMVQKAAKAAKQEYSCMTYRIIVEVEEQCGGVRDGFQGGLCFDVLFKLAGKWQQERGCHLSEFQQQADVYHACLKGMGVGDRGCVNWMADGNEGSACCCRAGPTGSCDVDDALAFSQDNDGGSTTTSTMQPLQSSTSLSTTTLSTTTAASSEAPFTCQTSDGRKVACGVRVCYEQQMRDNKMIKRGCGDEGTVPTSLLVAVCSGGDGPSCFSLKDNWSLCCCTTADCNDGKKVAAFVQCDEPAETSGMSGLQTIGVIVAALGVVGGLFLVPCAAWRFKH